MSNHILANSIFSLLTLAMLVAGTIVPVFLSIRSRVFQEKKILPLLSGRLSLKKSKRPKNFFDLVRKTQLGFQWFQGRALVGYRKISISEQYLCSFWNANFALNFAVCGIFPNLAVLNLIKTLSTSLYLFNQGLLVKTVLQIEFYYNFPVTKNAQNTVLIDQALLTIFQILLLFFRSPLSAGGLWFYHCLSFHLSICDFSQ